MNASFLPELIKLFQSQLNNLEKEIDLFEEGSLWSIKPGISNSGGNLTLHLIGNLNHYIGAIMGHTGYVRNRENEFSAQDIPAGTLIKMVQDTRMMIGDVLLNCFSEVALEEEYPLVVFDKPMTVQYFLLHLSAHLGYHSGQINYLRRISAC
jgi:hypothetical protein